MRILYKTSGGMHGYDRTLCFRIPEPGISGTSRADARATVAEFLRSRLFGHGPELNFSVPLLDSEIGEILEATEQLSKVREPVRKFERPLVDGWATRLALKSRERFLTLRWDGPVQSGWGDIQQFEKLLNHTFHAAICRRLCAVRKGSFYEFYYESKVRYYSAIKAACEADVTWREFLERMPPAARFAAYSWALDCSSNMLSGRVEVSQQTPIRNIPTGMLFDLELAEPPNPVSMLPCVPEQVAALVFKEGAEDILRVPCDKYDFFCECMRRVGYTISAIDERLIRPIVIR